MYWADDMKDEDVKSLDFWQCNGVGLKIFTIQTYHLCCWLSLAWVAKPTMIQGKCEISLGGGGGGGGEAGH